MRDRATTGTGCPQFNSNLGRGGTLPILSFGSSFPPTSAINSKASSNPTTQGGKTEVPPSPPPYQGSSLGGPRVERRRRTGRPARRRTAAARRPCGRRRPMGAPAEGGGAGLTTMGRPTAQRYAPGTVPVTGGGAASGPPCPARPHPAWGGGLSIRRWGFSADNQQAQGWRGNFSGRGALNR